MYLYKTGIVGASQIIFIGDGAPWIWNIVDEIINEMNINPEIIDKVLHLYHAAEQLWQVIDALPNLSQKQKRRLFKKSKTQLKNGEIDSDNEINAALSISHQGEISAITPVNLKKGLNKYQVNFEIKNPKLWWTNGLGDAFLYDLTSQLKAGTKLLDEDTQKVGIRTIRVVQSKDEKGNSFYFELNAVPVFAKGANYIPNDNFVPRVSPEKYEHIIKSAADANMNMLRGWGGGIYENDIFYYLCDQYGIMIWQDFMFACAMYPGNEAFLENVKDEAIQNVKRLRNHPCIALWCGNNEVDGAWSHNTPGAWGWKQRFGEETRAKIWNDYEKIFHQMLPSIVQEYDSRKFYWASSPLPIGGNGLLTAVPKVMYIIGVSGTEKRSLKILNKSFLVL